MSDDYGNASFRKSKSDKRQKRKNRVYKRGGKYRGIELAKEK